MAGYNRVIMIGNLTRDPDSWHRDKRCVGLGLHQTDNLKIGKLEI